MKNLHVNVANKKATYQSADGAIVCGNNTYNIEFVFDEEWAKHSKKTARFIVNGEYKAVEFTGNVCPVPVVSKVGQIGVGVYVDGKLATTVAEIPCVLSVLCNDAKKAGFAEDTGAELETVSGTIRNDATDSDTGTAKIHFTTSNNGALASGEMDFVMSYDDENGEYTGENNKAINGVVLGTIITVEHDRYVVATGAERVGGNSFRVTSDNFTLRFEA